MDWLTVFRGVDPGGEEEAQEVCEILRESGLAAELHGPAEPGVARGTYEVRVPADQAERAAQIIAAQREIIEQPLDTSHELDLVTVFSSDAHNAEMEATAVHSLLEANGIPALLVSPGPIPSLPYEVRVPRSRMEEARSILAAAEEAGAAAADEAEDASSGQP
ncbi:MAG: putative signal transducing protein [Bryobacteraceae bacterium]